MSFIIANNKLTGGSQRADRAATSSERVHNNTPVGPARELVRHRGPRGLRRRLST